MLVYYLIDNKKNLKGCNLNFDSKFKFDYNKKNKSLHISKNNNLLENYWGNNINSLTAIAGNNGIGKTTILGLIKNRFLSGLNFLDETILVMKKNEEYIMYYDEEILEDKKVITINNQLYNVSEIYIKEETNVGTIEINVGSELLKLSVQRIPKGSNRDNYLKIRNDTRLGKERSLIFYTNHWGYSRYDRFYKQYTEKENLDYFDLSIGYKIDSSINSSRNYEEIFSDDMRVVNGVTRNNRFKIDYLYRLKEREIENTLRYLNDIDNDKKNESYLIIPEDIEIGYDFLDSIERKEFFPVNNDSNIYLRFEKKEDNFHLEQEIYNYIIDSKKELDLTLRESMILILVENLFSNLDLILSDKLKKLIKSKEKGIHIKISDSVDIYNLLNDFIEIIIAEIEKEKFSENLKNIRQQTLKERAKNLIESYVDFMKYLSGHFLENANFERKEGYYYEMDKGTISTRIIKMKTLIIPLNKMNNKFVYKLVRKYSKLTGSNRSLYFTWRDLSAGETQLLNLFTNLYTAIKDAKYKEILILLDEVEISLHPMLQKKFMKMLVNLLNSPEIQNKNIQVVLTTHSPFVLSELPFNSLILLKKDAIGSVIVQNELENFSATLGANVHELFSHSFFLTEGLIGDYAKEKINEVANNLLNIYSNLDQDYIEKFINQIGEPIIKGRLLELYEQKWTLNKPNEFEKITQDIEILKRQLADLKKKGD